MEDCLLSFVNSINCLAFKQKSQQTSQFYSRRKKITRVQIQENSELNGYLDTLFLFLVFVPIQMTSTDPTRRSKLFCHTSTTTRTAIMQIRSCKPTLNSCKGLCKVTFCGFSFIVRQLKLQVSKSNKGQKLKIRMQETSKVFNLVPSLALALVHRQNDGRISLQKQTSNDKRQSNLTKLGINLLFVSENVLLYDFESFQMQECSLTLWSRNQHIA